MTTGPFGGLTPAPEDLAHHLNPGNRGSCVDHCQKYAPFVWPCCRRCLLVVYLTNECPKCPFDTEKGDPHLALCYGEHCCVMGRRSTNIVTATRRHIFFMLSNPAGVRVSNRANMPVVLRLLDGEAALYVDTGSGPPSSVCAGSEKIKNCVRRFLLTTTAGRAGDLDLCLGASGSLTPPLCRRLPLPICN